MIQAVIFDMGGVLISERESKARLHEFDKLLGFKQGELNQKLYSGPAWLAVSTGNIDIDTYWQKVGEPFEKDLPPDFTYYRDNFYGGPLDLAMVTMAWRLRPYYKIALLSNATPMLMERLQSEPRLHGLFDTTVISAIEGMRKPDPGIYHLTCERLQLPIDACVLIDDKVRNTEAARAQNMRALVHRNPLQTERLLRKLGVQPGRSPDTLV